MRYVSNPYPTDPLADLIIGAMASVLRLFLSKYLGRHSSPGLDAVRENVYTDIGKPQGIFLGANAIMLSNTGKYEQYRTRTSTVSFTEK